MQYYQNPYIYRKPVIRPTKSAMNFSADDVWAAAWQAYVDNGNQYVKAIAPDIPNHQTNRTIVEELLKDPSMITQASREQGDIVRRYYKGLTFKLIEGRSLSPFLQGAYEAACKDNITDNFDLGVIISLPSSYVKSNARDEVDRRINFAKGGFVGSVGDNVDMTIEVVKQLWSEKYNTWYFTGINQLDQVVFFAHRKQLEVGSTVKIHGKVKSHRETSTQLSHVKEVK